MTEPDTFQPSPASVLVVGVAVLDYVFYVKDFPTTAEKFRAEDHLVMGGGCAANAAVAVARLGGRALLSSRLADDHTGRVILDDLAAEGVDTALCDRSGTRSSCSSILVDAKGERQIVNFRGAGLVQTTDHIAAAPETVGAVLADTRWGAGALAAMELARARGVPGVLDIEADADVSVLGPASHMAFSEQGLAALFPGLAPDRALERVVELFGGWGCVTLGAGGVLTYGTEGPGHVPAPAVTAVESLGAGDYWHGAFALRLAEGAKETDAVRFANAVAALKCTRTGGRASLPGRAETESFMEEDAR